MNKLIWITAIFIFCSSQLFAYKPNDETATMSLFDKNWKIIDQGQTDQSRRLIIINENRQLQYISLDDRKGKGTDGKKYAELKYQQFVQEHPKYRISPLLAIQSANDKLFSEWTFSYESAEMQSSGVIIYIDADPLNFYVFGLVTNKTALTAELKAAMLNELRSNVKICYKPEKIPQDKTDLSFCHAI